MNERKIADVNIVDHESIMRRLNLSISEEVAYSEKWRDFEGFARPKDGLVLILCYEGHLDITIDADSYTVGPNDLMVWSPNTTVGHPKSSADFRCAMLYISVDALVDIIPRRDRRVQVKGFDFKPIGRLSAEMMELVEHYKKFVLERKRAAGKYSQKVVRSLVGALVYELFQFWSETMDMKTEAQSSSDILFRRFVQAVNDDEVKHRSVSYYAQKLYVTPKYLSVVCKEKSGQSAMEFINSMVMLDVRRLLTYSDMSIKEVSSSLGFPNVSFFGKYVKAHTGMTPRSLQRGDSVDKADEEEQ